MNNLLTALTAWSLKGIPRDPGAWLYQVAFNTLRDQSRRDGAWRRSAERLARDDVEAPTEASLRGELHDDELRMLFVCCDDRLSAPSQLALALKVLCGFSVREVALRLPITASLISTISVLPERQRSSFKEPSFASAAAMAFAKVMRASSAKWASFTPRMTSPTASCFSAGEPLATSVTRICRASREWPFALKIHPRAPVGPSVQSCSLPGWSPLVKSGGVSVAGAAMALATSRHAVAEMSRGR